MELKPIFDIILPETIVGSVACLLMLLGVSGRVGVRKAVPWVAIATLGGVFCWLLFAGDASMTSYDASGAVRLHAMGNFVKMLAAGVGVLLILMSWPTNADGSGNQALIFGQDSGEYFGLMLMSISGLMLVSSANDLMLLFLAIELASLPAYVLVSVGRPIPVAQEAGVKYFFLGAMAAAILLFGFSYLYGTTGVTSLYDIAARFRATATTPNGLPALTTWQTMAIVVTMLGLAFKLAAVPFHAYVGDVYQGAATPVTAFLAFVPKASGLVALLKILWVAGGGQWMAPEVVLKLVWWMAVLTMTFGNVLGLLQNNVKRVLAYSSIAHSGYMLVGVTAILYGATLAENREAVTTDALQSVLFYLAAYALMNTAAFAVLTVLPAHDQESRRGMAAETFDDLAGLGRRHLPLGLAMAVSCFSLIGIPLTVGFYGKLFLVRPALHANLYGLVTITMLNAAISAAYYLRIVGAMFLRPEPGHNPHPHHPHIHIGPIHVPHDLTRATVPIIICVVLSTFGTILFGTFFNATQVLYNKASNSAYLDAPIVGDRPPPAAGAKTPDDDAVAQAH